MVKIAIAGVIGAFVLFYIMTSPDHAVELAHGTWDVVVSIGHGIADVARGIGRFLDKLVS